MGNACGSTGFGVMGSSPLLLTSISEDPLVLVSFVPTNICGPNGIKISGDANNGLGSLDDNCGQTNVKVLGNCFGVAGIAFNLTGFEASGNSSDGLKVVNKCLLVAGPPCSLVPSLEPAFMSVAGEESAVADPKLSATY